MGSLLFYLLAGLVLAGIFINVYFRVKVWKLYKKVEENRIQLGAGHIFNKSRREAELYPRYERYRELIESFCGSIVYSIKVAIFILLSILVIGLIFIYV